MTMELSEVKRRLSNRYLSLIYLELVMIYVHLRIISIHPLIFLVWPLSLWLFIEILDRFRGKMFNMLLFFTTFVAYVLVTQVLVVERPEGIFFDLEPLHNMPILSNFVLAEAVLLFLYDAFLARSITFRDLTAYIGFASVIPWLSPTVVEGFILTRWFLEGRFTEMTMGKGIGGAGLNDILFHYGGRNLLFSTTLCSAGILVLHGYRYINRLIEERRSRKSAKEEDLNWMRRVWENPLELLSLEEQTEFISAHRHLDEEQRNDALRSEVLPAKGIILIDPRDLE